MFQSLFFFVAKAVKALAKVEGVTSKMILVHDVELS